MCNLRKKGVSKLHRKVQGKVMAIRPEFGTMGIEGGGTLDTDEVLKEFDPPILNNDAQGSTS